MEFLKGRGRENPNEKDNGKDIENQREVVENQTEVAENQIGVVENQIGVVGAEGATEITAVKTITNSISVTSPTKHAKGTFKISLTNMARFSAST